MSDESKRKMKFLIAVIFVFQLFMGIVYADSLIENAALDVSTGAATVIDPDPTVGGDEETTTFHTLTKEDVTMSGSMLFKFNADVEKIGTDIIIPSEIDGVKVTTIANNVFSKKGLTSVVLPESIYKIGAYAFYDNQLSSLDIPDSVTILGQGAFDTNLLESVTLSEGLTEINDRTFSGNKLTHIKIPESVTKIGKYAFSMNELTSIEFPENVSIIEEGAFGFNKLNSLEIPEGVTYIGHLAFNKNHLRHIILSGGIEMKTNSFLNNDQLIELKVAKKEMSGQELKAGFTDGLLYYGDGKIVEDTDSISVGESIYLKRFIVRFDMENSSESQYVVSKLDDSFPEGYGGVATPPSVPSVDGKVFVGWDSDDYLRVISDLVITAQYAENSPNSGGSSSSGRSNSTEYYTVTFKDYDGKILGKDRVREGRSAETPKKPTRVGYTFKRWNNDYTNVKRDLVIIAQYEEKKNSKAYMIGMPDGTFQPEKNLTRAELVSLLDRFYSLENKYKINTQYDKYSDVANNAWYHDALNRMTQEGLVSGYEDGTFRPNNYVTREELAQIVYNHFNIGSCYTRQINSEFYGNIYKDIYNRWSSDALIGLQIRGLLQDFTQDTFNPTAPISRGETVLLFNRYFGYDSGYDEDYKVTFNDISADSKWSVPVALASKDLLIKSDFISALQEEISDIID